MIIALIQARMSSSRLPGKVLKLVRGKSALARVVERVRRARTPQMVAVATTTNASDDAIERACAALGTLCFRGQEHDVLHRFYVAAKLYGGDAIMRVTADCPLIDPMVVDAVGDVFGRGEHDYVANINPPTYPDGLDVELFTFAALESAWRGARLRSEREHVTLYIRNHPELFRIGNIRCDRDLSHLRWTVDEPRDLEFVEAVYERLGDGPFGLEETLSLVEREKGLTRLNSGIMRDTGLMKSLAADSVE
jgi:spore coat polysaccharide biosynthesis protein SpsF (cytidylyltransferase family)